MTAGPIIDIVFDANQLEGLCDRDAFRADSSSNSAPISPLFLDLEYQSRLTEPRITMK